MTNKIQTIYRSSSLPLVASLAVGGFIIEEIEFDNPNRAVFIFKQSSELQEAINQFWRGELRVNPQEYFDQLKILKTRIYQR